MKVGLNPAVKRGLKTIGAAAVSGAVLGALNSVGVVLPDVVSSLSGNSEWLALGTAIVMALEKAAEKVFGRNI